MNKIQNILFLLLLNICCIAKADTFIVQRVIDGDTIILNNGEKVRLIGVNTPEMRRPEKPGEYFGRESRAFTRKLCQGKEVYLEYDHQRKDSYDRTLAYLYLNDGTFVNAEIIKHGYGYAYTHFSFKYKERFLRHQRLAQKLKRGLWKEIDKKKDSQDTLYVVSRNSNIYHHPWCSFAEQIKKEDLMTLKSKSESKSLGYISCRVCQS